MNLKMVSHIFVDFDGTLVNSIDSLYRSYCELVQYYGIKESREEFNSLNGPSTFEIIQILKNKHDLDDEVKEMYSRYIDIIKKHYTQTEKFLDSDKFLSSLYRQKKKIILVTSNRAEMCLPLIEKLNWSKYFSDYVWGESVKYSKPSPDIYLEACRRSGVEKTKIIVIEDSLSGVQAACAADLVVFGLNLDFSKNELKKAGATKVFASLSLALEDLNRL